MAQDREQGSRDSADVPYCPRSTRSSREWCCRYHSLNVPLLKRLRPPSRQLARQSFTRKAKFSSVPKAAPKVSSNAATKASSKVSPKPRSIVNPRLASKTPPSESSSPAQAITEVFSTKSGCDCLLSCIICLLDITLCVDEYDDELYAKEEPYFADHFLDSM
ncbi:hypothetical protein L917_01143 [Phytophthora nicotianae]|uniref:Uncharacterized protein n=1 Tax=Phytophthora nicotianae TaxID=4792 RepID=W2LY30_PHYNI|nr:hypothetical protein L917_01143 [Phytophthora nicotianae]